MNRTRALLAGFLVVALLPGSIALAAKGPRAAKTLESKTLNEKEVSDLLKDHGARVALRPGESVTLVNKQKRLGGLLGVKTTTVTVSAVKQTGVTAWAKGLFTGKRDYEIVGHKAVTTSGPSLGTVFSRSKGLQAVAGSSDAQTAAGPMKLIGHRADSEQASSTPFAASRKLQAAAPSTSRGAQTGSTYHPSAYAAGRYLAANGHALPAHQDVKENATGRALAPNDPRYLQLTEGYAAASAPTASRK